MKKIGLRRRKLRINLNNFKNARVICKGDNLIGCDFVKEERIVWLDGR